MSDFTRKGERKVGRPLCEDGEYARDMGVRKALIKSLGGAAYLQARDDFTRNLLLKSTGSTQKRMRLRG